MPTYVRTPEFMRDLERLTPEQRLQFDVAVREFVADLKSGSPVQKSLGVKRLKSQAGVWEFAWAGDGRALFAYGTSPIPGQALIVWLRVGTHDIFR